MRVMARSVVLLLTGVFHLAWLTLSIIVFPALPLRYARHFDGAGAADRFGRFSMAEWLELPLAGLAVTCTVAGLYLYVERLASERGSCSPADRRLLALDRALIPRVFALVGVTSIAPLLIAHISLYLAVSTQRTRLGSTDLALEIICILLGLLGLIRLAAHRESHRVDTRGRVDV